MLRGVKVSAYMAEASVSGMASSGYRLQVWLYASRFQGVSWLQVGEYHKRCNTRGSRAQR